jgi:hypothetical protein
MIRRRGSRVKGNCISFAANRPHQGANLVLDSKKFGKYDNFTNVIPLRGSPTVSDEKPKKPIERGPKGGRKHTPGRGHNRKSESQKKNRFTRKAERQRDEAVEAAREAWTEWDALSDDAKKLLPEKRPKEPRPEDAS